MHGNSLPRNEAQADFDSYDLAIMSALSEDATLPMTELSKIVNLSRTAIARRVAALQDIGALGPAKAAINYSKLGFSIHALMDISAPKRDTFRVRDELLARPEVLNLWVVLGEHLMIAEIIAYDTKHLHQFLTWLHDFGFSETNVTLQHIESRTPLRNRLRLLKELTSKIDHRLTEIDMPIEA